MKEHGEFDLLADIAKLLKKHGPETFELLADRLSSERFLTALLDILDTTAKAARKPQTRAGQIGIRPNRKKSPREFLASLSDIEPEKSKLLLQFYDSILSQTILPSFKDIQFFASENGLPQLKARSRKEAIPSLMRSLSALPVEEINRIANKARQPVPDDRSLEGWSKIILEKGRRNKEQREE